VKAKRRGLPRIRAALSAAAALLVIGAAPVYAALTPDVPGPQLTSQPAPKPAGVSPNPCDRLAAGEVKFDVGDAARVTFATARAYGESEVLLTGCVADGDGGYWQEWQTTGFAGRNGFAPEGRMWENTLFSPTGTFTVTEALGRADPGTKLKYYQLNESSRWGGEKGPTYNQYFEGEGGPADENLWRYMNSGLYEQAAVINWNRPPDMPVTQGASFAIFLHAGNAKTWGCISTDLATVTAFLRTAVPGDRMVMGVQKDVFVASTARSDVAAANRDAQVDAAKMRAIEQRVEAAQGTSAGDARAGNPHWEPFAVVGFAVALAAYRAAKVRFGGAREAERKTQVTH
jgi:L,D-peptidoglycan transpeptidase YkuD (ErfK/YbiS/YcfS/YnhG family)